MIVFRKFNFDINLVAGLGTDKLIFETGNKGAGTEFQRIIAAFAALELNTVYRTHEVNHDNIAFSGLFISDGNGFLTSLSKIVQSLFNFFGRNFSHKFVQRDFRKVVNLDFRKIFNGNLKFNIFTVCKRSNFYVRLHCRTQFFILNDFFGCGTDGLVKNFTNHRIMVFLLEHCKRSLTGTKTGKFCIFGNLFDFLVNLLSKISSGNRNFEFFV